MDTISDMIIRIKNAEARKTREIILPFSNLKLEVAKILKEQGYLTEVKEVKEGNKRDLLISLDYDSELQLISGFKRVSKLGRRVYKGYNEIPRVLNGVGFAIISSSKGVITDETARRQKIGGEILCEIY